MLTQRGKQLIALHARLLHKISDPVLAESRLVGDAFDVLFRANMKNMALLRRHLEKTGYARPVGGTVLREMPSE